jgi:hypothetical protein
MAPQLHQVSRKFNVHFRDHLSSATLLQFQDNSESFSTMPREIVHRVERRLILYKTQSAMAMVFRHPECGSPTHRYTKCGECVTRLKVLYGS